MILIDIIVVIFFGLLIVGAIKRWPIIVDPDKKYWMIWAPSAFRIIFEPEQLRIVTILLYSAVLILYALLLIF